MTAPVVLVSFNRPENTRRALDHIRKAAPDQVFLLADGPRPGHRDDVDKCAAVRHELESIDWPCEVHRRFSDENLGCEASVELGLDWVFEHVSEAIILEDDCLPDPSFFGFCTELLERFRDDLRVAQIAGNSPPVPHSFFEGSSYAFSAWGSIWGWATWRRSWQAHRVDFPRSHGTAGLSLPDNRPIRVKPVSWQDTLLLTRGCKRFFKDASSSMKRNNFGWDSHWCVSIISSKSLVITPSINLCENVGFGEQATHTRSPRAMPKARAITLPLSHPDEVALNAAVELELEHLIAWHQGRVGRFLARTIPRGRLRIVVRAVGTGVAERMSRSRARRPTNSAHDDSEPAST